MASSSGNSTTSSKKRSSGLEGELAEMNERKRKRMQSNRESAKRSRMRKQKHLDDLSSQVDELTRENQQIMKTISSTNHEFVNVEAENSILRAQMSELIQRLFSLKQIINYMNALGAVDYDDSNNNNSFNEVDHLGFLANGMNMMGDFGFFNGYNVDPWTMQGYFNQPSFAASIDVLQC